MQISKKWKIIIGILILGNVVIVGIVLLQGGDNKKTAELTSLTDVVPGKTTSKEISAVPNRYHEQTTNDGAKTYFGNNAPKQYSEIISKNGVVVAYKKTNPNSFAYKTLGEYRDRHGSTSWTIETESSEFGFQGYVYAESGIIVFAHETSGEVIEEWVVEKNVSQETIKYLFPSSNEKVGH
jgi:hypothetical protein